MFIFFRKNHLLMVFTAVFTLFLVLLSGCATKKEPAWKAVNDKVIAEHNVQVHERTDLIDTGIISNLEPGKVTNIKTFPVVEFAPGVKGQMYWGKGVLVNFMTMEPNAELPKETLPSERLMIMLKGSVEQIVEGSFVKMECTDVQPMYYFATGYIGRKDALFLESGSENAVKAGPNGAEFVEVYYPVRTDYITKTGAAAPAKTNSGNYNAKPNFPANKVFDYYTLQSTELVKGAWSQLFNGKGAQASLLFMKPGITFDYHCHPEEQIMIVLRGQCDEIVMDGKQMMNVGDIVYLPSQMVHGGVLPEKGANVLDVFWPVRTDYQDLEKARYDAYHAVIPEGEEPKLIAEGFKFTEGPAWMDGTLYFSSMFFDIPAGTWKSDPKKSDLIAMKPDGTWKKVWEGKTQTNGLMAKGNGNLVVCDMSGHRIVEVAPNGREVKVLATKMKDGTRLDGPNDLVIDAKGGIYFTDPQFIFDEKKQPGKTVNYIKPDGEVIRVVEPGEFGMENGLALSPDGKVLYVNNTYHNENNMSEAENCVYAYDINDDGTLFNKRRFAELFLPPSEYEVGTRSSCADGMRSDSLGNIWVATNIGVQIFNSKGEFIGNIHTTTFPVSLCFGGDDFQTLYMVGWDKIYAVRTNVKGLQFPVAK